ncbi:probable E3 ubiquitin-protein ligase ZFP1 [Vitis riparia]|uniref:probable E3 ubiquitin-protein ligase ZFP1 n=1 Tax=Vitis riparia TaxID=96939 RepID=UPI00155A1CD7|nr:probable E3 ubiquitin-protein ligase ZFP1 [Vitis riparia]
MDSASFAQPQFRAIMEVGSHRSVRNRSGAVGLDSVLEHNHNHMVQGIHIGHPFQPSGNPWVDQRSGNNGSDGGTLAWNHGLLYLICMGAISVEVLERLGMWVYRDIMIHLVAEVPPITFNLLSFTGTIIFIIHHHHHHHCCKEQEVGVEAGPRHPGPVPPTGIRTYPSHRGGVVPEATSRHGNLPYLRMLPAEEVAILDLSAFYEVGEVSTGLSEKSITNCLKTRTYISLTCLNLKEAASMDQENDSCIICREEYQNHEKIVFLDCGHEYHADCLKKWLLVKNVCPICKAPEMTPKNVCPK